MIESTRSYLDQSPEVQARFAKIRSRDKILQVRHLSKSFKTPQGQIEALRDVSFDVHRREFVCIVGASGCGKSTLARILAGLDVQTQGEMLLDGQPVTGPGHDRGMVFQGYSLFPWLTVKHNVMFGPRMSGQGRGEAESRAREWLALVGLEKFADAYPHQLSGGMRQRVAIWRNVDVTVVFITHDLDEAIYLADRILVLKPHPGRVQEFIEVPVPRPRSLAQWSGEEFRATKQRLEASIDPERPTQAADDEPTAEHLPMIRMTDVHDSVE